MTLTEIRAWVKQRYRLNTTELDSQILNMANDALTYLCRRARWRQLRVLDATITTTTASAYNLPAAFDRLIPNSVRYDTTSSDQGRIIPEVGLEQFTLYRTLSESSAPSVCMAGPKSASTAFQLYFAPDFSETGKTVTYSYLKKPTALASGSDSTEVPELDFAVCYMVLQGISEFHGDLAKAQYFGSESRRCFNSAFMQISAES